MISARLLLLTLLLALCLAPAARAKSGFEIHVAPGGSAEADGSKRHPFASLESARDRIRTLRRGRAFPPGGITVLVHGGRYAVTNTFALSREDTGYPGMVIVWRAADKESPVFSGGIRLTNFTYVTDASLRERLAESVVGSVVQADLRAVGLSNLPPLELGGFASGRGFYTHPAPELFFDGYAMPRAGWPDRSFAPVNAVSTNAVFTEHGRVGSRAGWLRVDCTRLARWATEPELWLHGYWYWDWADSYERVARVTPTQNAIELAPPFSTYGYRAGQPFRAVNALCELDQPGEWMIDRSRGLLFFLPPLRPTSSGCGTRDPTPVSVRGATVELSLLRSPLIRLDHVSHVRLERFTWELGAGDGAQLADCSEVVLSGCVVRNGGGNGIEVTGGASNVLTSCAVHGMARGGIVLQGGDRRTLTPGGHRLENCHIFDLSRADRTYTPAVLVGGVGQVVVHNHLHHVPSSALRVGGDDHLVAWNEIDRVVLESDDQGAVDMWGDPTFRGNRYLNNFFHDIGGAWNGAGDVKLGQAGIRLDDAISGTLIAGNVFQRCGAGQHGFGAIQIHGGKENLVESNLFVECTSAVSCSPWDDKRWRAFVAGRLARGDLDATVHLARHPELARLEEDANANELRGNLVVNGPLLRHAPAALRESGNLVLTNAAPPATLLRQRGAPAIPLKKIGLQADLWYAARPSEPPFAIAEKFQSLETLPVALPTAGIPPRGDVP